MGRPPSNGAPSFRFNPVEVAQMEAILQKYEGHVPPRDLLETLASNFSNTPDRAGKVTVQMKQVWNWFQNRRYAMRSKLGKSPGTPNTTPVARDDVNTVRNIAHVPIQMHLPSAPNVPRNMSEPPQMEFEAKSARDGAWYDVQQFLSTRFLDTANPEVLVRFAGFGPEEDEWINIKMHVRQRSLPCEASECVVVIPGDLILCFQEGREQALYFDAHVLDAQRRRHDMRGCRCRFLVRYDHDQSEEIVPLRKICRRPETDYRLQLLYAPIETPSASVPVEPLRPVVDLPSSSTSLRVNPDPNTVAVASSTVVNAPSTPLPGAVQAPMPNLAPTSAQALTSARAPTLFQASTSSPTQTLFQALTSTPVQTLVQASTSTPVPTMAQALASISAPTLVQSSTSTSVTNPPTLTFHTSTSTPAPPLVQAPTPAPPAVTSATGLVATTTVPVSIPSLAPVTVPVLSTPNPIPVSVKVESDNQSAPAPQPEAVESVNPSAPAPQPEAVESVIPSAAPVPEPKAAEGVCLGKPGVVESIPSAASVPEPMVIESADLPVPAAEVSEPVVSTVNPSAALVPQPNVAESVTARMPASEAAAHPDVASPGKAEIVLDAKEAKSDDSETNTALPGSTDSRGPVPGPEEAGKSTPVDSALEGSGHAGVDGGAVTMSAGEGSSSAVPMSIDDVKE